MSHRVSEAARMAILIAGTLALAVCLCLVLAGVVQLALATIPSAAPVLGIIFGLLALAAGYLGFRAMVERLFGRTYG